MTQATESEMAADGDSVSKKMKEDGDKEVSTEEMDVDSIDERSALEWVLRNKFIDVYWPFLIVTLWVMNTSSVKCEKGDVPRLSLKARPASPVKWWYLLITFKVLNILEASDV